MITKETHIRTVGIAGSTRGSGTTHLAVSLANYASSGLLEKSAYIEAGGQGELTRWKTPGKSGYFTEKGVHFYPNVKREDIPILLNRDYKRLIFDFGEKYLFFREEILRCDRKIFLLNISHCGKAGAGVSGGRVGESYAPVCQCLCFPKGKKPNRRSIPYPHYGDYRYLQCICDIRKILFHDESAPGGKCPGEEEI